MKTMDNTNSFIGFLKALTEDVGSSMLGYIDDPIIEELIVKKIANTRRILRKNNGYNNLSDSLKKENISIPQVIDYLSRQNRIEKDLSDSIRLELVYLQNELVDAIPKTI